jgi:hypothetical protein
MDPRQGRVACASHFRNFSKEIEWRKGKGNRGETEVEMNENNNHRRRRMNKNKSKNRSKNKNKNKKYKSKNKNKNKKKRMVSAGYKSNEERDGWCRRYWLLSKPEN